MMTDDHNRCEWVNVSSSTNSPGLSRTNGHKKVVVVVVDKTVAKYTGNYCSNLFFLI